MCLGHRSWSQAFAAGGLAEKLRGCVTRSGKS